MSGGLSPLGSHISETTHHMHGIYLPRCWDRDRRRRSVDASLHTNVDDEDYDEGAKAQNYDELRPNGHVAEVGVKPA